MPSWTDRQLPSTLLPSVGPWSFGVCTVQPGFAHQQCQLKQSFTNAMCTQNTQFDLSHEHIQTWDMLLLIDRQNLTISLPIPSSTIRISSSPLHENQRSAWRSIFGSPEYIFPTAEGKISRDEHHSHRNTYLYQRCSFTCYSKGLF